MKLTIKTTLYVLFSSAFLFSQETGRNYAVFNSLIRHTDIEDFYTINELRRVFENPEVQELEEVLSRFKQKPEKTKSYKEYRAIFLNEKRIKEGAQFFFDNKSIFKKIIQDFKIDPLIIVAIVVTKTNWYQVESLEPTSTVRGVGKLLLTKYLLPFEAVSVLLLGALIGAAVLSRKTN